jgi:hypothetical protein
MKERTTINQMMNQASLMEAFIDTVSDPEYKAVVRELNEEGRVEFFLDAADEVKMRLRAVS